MGLPGPRPVPGPMGPNGEPGLQLGAISPGEITRDPPKQVGLRNEFPETWLWKLYVIGYVEFHLNIWWWSYSRHKSLVLISLHVLLVLTFGVNCSLIATTNIIFMYFWGYLCSYWYCKHVPLDVGLSTNINIWCWSLRLSTNINLWQLSSSIPDINRWTFISQISLRVSFWFLYINCSQKACSTFTCSYSEV